MKKRICIILLALLFIPTYVNALSFDKTIDKKIDSILSYDTGYIETIDNELNSYINNELVSNKKFSDLTNISIIKYNENFILVGLKNNKLKCYYIDSNLKVLSQNESSTIISNGNPKLYIHDNKIYVLLINNGILSTNNIYVIDNELNIEETKLSNISNIKDIIKSDYYIINNSGNTKDGITEYYYNSTYVNDNNIIVGYKEDLYNEKNAIIKYIDKEGYIKWIDDNKDYKEFNDCIILENKIYVIANNEFETFLLSYDYDGNKINSTKISEGISYKFNKLQNKLYILNDNKEILYDYAININIESNIYGKTTYTGDAIPYNKIILETIPNSGYKLLNYKITDEQGNEIQINENEFIMPLNSVNIIVNYEETIINPDTVDMIFVVFAISGIALIVFTRTYKQYRWLKG